MKIAVVAPKSTADSVMKPEHLAELGEMGDVVRNQTEVADAETVSELSTGAEVVITSWGCPQFGEELLSELDRLQLVVHAAGSVKGIVSDALFDRGVRITGGNGPLGLGVAETALGMTITSLKNMWRMVADTSTGGWWDERPRVRELYEVTVGVVGAGKAGTHYIRLLGAFDVRVLLYDPTMSTDAVSSIGATKVDLPTLLSQSDVVSIHAPAIPDTENLIDGEALVAMKDDAILINTSRGTIVDQDALLTELSSGRLFACLDVTEPEPLPVDHPLRSLPNCVVTGHIAGAVTNGRYRLGRFAVDEVERYVAGEPLTGEVLASQLSVLA